MSQPHEVPELDTATLARLARGDVIIHNETAPGSSTPEIVLQAVIDAPVESVWKLIDQSAKYVEFMPRMKKSEELSRVGDEVRTRITIDMPFPLRNLTSTSLAKHTVIPGVMHRRQWRMESGDYKVNEGSWVLSPFPDAPTRTLATYRARIQPNIPLPNALKNLAQEKALPGMVEALRQRVKTHG